MPRVSASVLWCGLLLLLAAPAHAVDPRYPPPVAHVHSSSRYDRPADTLGRAVRSYARRAGVITWTEVSADHRARELHKLRSWRSYTPDGTDVAASWRRDRWRVRHLSAPVLSPFHFTTTGGYRSLTQHAAVSVLDRRADKLRLLLVVAHLPARPRESPARGRVWGTALAELRELVPELRRRWCPDLVLITGDWNVTARRVSRAFPGLSLTWRGPAPGVNGTYTNGRGVAHLLAPNASSDHRPYAERVYTPRRES